MGFNDFWINNNGKKEHLNSAKHGVRKDQVDKKFHNLFDAYDSNNDGTLESEELKGIFKGLNKFAGEDKTLDAAENKYVASLFSSQAGIDDADFLGFVGSISKASEDIIESKEITTLDGGKEITTTYKDGTVETISYYPDGDYKFKKLDQEKTKQDYYTIGGDLNNKFSADDIEKKIKERYQQYCSLYNKPKKSDSSNDSSLAVPVSYNKFKQKCIDTYKIKKLSSMSERHDLFISERGRQDIAVRDFILSHYIETHKSAKDALESMGILDDSGAIINSAAGEFWNSIKNVWNGTDEEYQNFYELLLKFSPEEFKGHGVPKIVQVITPGTAAVQNAIDSIGDKAPMGSYEKSLIVKSQQEVMLKHPEMYFRNFETDFKKEMGHQFNLESSVIFQQTVEQYQNAQILKQRIDILNKAMLEIRSYQAEQDALTHAPAQNEGLNPAKHILNANNLLLQYFDNDQDAVDMILNGTIANADDTIKAISGIKKDTEKLNASVLNGKTFEQIQEDYKSQYKAMYGTDFVPDELTEKVLDAKATGGMVKLAIITTISILVTRSPIMAELSAAAGGAEVSGAAANMIRTLVAKYGQAAVQQGIKFAMTSGTLATDVGLTLINQATSERGVNGEELWESTKGSAKYIFFGAYIGAPLAQAVSKSLGKIGATTRLFDGGIKTSEGAIQTTSITGDKLVQNFMKGGNKVLTKGGALLTEIGAFAGLDVVSGDMDIAEALGEQSTFLPKLKLMNHVLEYMLGARAHTATSRAYMNAAIEKSGVKNWNIKEIKSPQKTEYIVDIDGLPVGRFKNANELATAMLERVTANYSESVPLTNIKPESKEEQKVENKAEIENETKTKTKTQTVSLTGKNLKDMTYDELIGDLNKRLQNKSNIYDLMEYFKTIKENDPKNFRKMKDGNISFYDKNNSTNYNIEYDKFGNIIKYSTQKLKNGINNEDYIYDSNGNVKLIDRNGYCKEWIKNRADEITDFFMENPDILPKDTRDLILQDNNHYCNIDDIKELASLLKTQEDIDITNKLLNTKGNESRYIRAIGNALKLSQQKFGVKDIVKVLKSEAAKKYVLEHIEKNKYAKKTELSTLLNEGDKFGVTVEHDLNSEIDLSYQTKEINLNAVFTDLPRTYEENATIRKQINAQVPDGEAACINGQMYCRADGKLIPINLTKETFDRLFPVEERYNIKQGRIGDCYFIAELGAYMASPNGRATLYSAFRQEGNDIILKFPGLDNFEIKFENGELNKLYPISLYKHQDKWKIGSGKAHVKACDGIQMVEQAYSFIRNNYDDAEIQIVANDKFLMNKQMQELEGSRMGNPAGEVPWLLGNTEYVIYYNKDCRSLGIRNAETVEEGLETLANEAENNPNVFGSLSFGDDVAIDNGIELITGHQYRIIGYDKTSQTVLIINPHDSNKYLEISLDIFKKAKPKFNVYKIIINSKTPKGPESPEASKAETKPDNKQIPEKPQIENDTPTTRDKINSDENSGLSENKSQTIDNSGYEQISEQIPQENNTGLTREKINFVKDENVPAVMEFAKWAKENGLEEYYENIDEYDMLLQAINNDNLETVKTVLSYANKGYPKYRLAKLVFLEGLAVNDLNYKEFIQLILDNPEIESDLNYYSSFAIFTERLKDISSYKDGIKKAIDIYKSNSDLMLDEILIKTMNILQDEYKDIIVLKNIEIKNEEDFDKTMRLARPDCPWYDDVLSKNYKAYRENPEIFLELLTMKFSDYDGHMFTAENIAEGFETYCKYRDTLKSKLSTLKYHYKSRENKPLDIIKIQKLQGNFSEFMEKITEIDRKMLISNQDKNTGYEPVLEKYNFEDMEKLAKLYEKYGDIVTKLATSTYEYYGKSDKIVKYDVEDIEELAQYYTKNTDMSKFLQDPNYFEKIKLNTASKYQKEIMALFEPGKMSRQLQMVLLNSGLSTEDFLNGLKKISKYTYKVAYETPNQYLNDVKSEYANPVNGKYPEVPTEELREMRNDVNYFFIQNFDLICKTLKYIDPDTVSHLMDKRMEHFQETLYGINKMSKNKLELLSKLLTCKSSQTGNMLSPRNKTELLNIVQIFEKAKLDTTILDEAVKSGTLDIDAVKDHINTEVLKKSGIKETDIPTIKATNKNKFNKDYFYLSLLDRIDNPMVDEIAKEAKDLVHRIKTDKTAYEEAMKKIESQYNQVKEMMEKGQLHFSDEILEAMEKEYEMYKNFDKYTEEELYDQSMETVYLQLNKHMKSPEQYTIIKEALLGNFSNFITDTSNKYGKTNANTEAIFNEKGLSYKYWNNPELTPTTITVKGKPLSIRLWDRNPLEDLFIGNKTTCCTAIGTGMNGAATPGFLLNKAYNVVELFDESGNVVGMSRVFMAEVEGKPTIIMDNIELNNTFIKGMNQEELINIRNGFFEYMNRYAQKVTNDSETQVLFNKAVAHVPILDLEKVSKTVSLVGKIAEDELYVNIAYNSDSHPDGWVRPEGLESLGDLPYMVVPRNNIDPNGTKTNTTQTNRVWGATGEIVQPRPAEEISNTSSSSNKFDWQIFKEEQNDLLDIIIKHLETNPDFVKFRTDRKEYGQSDIQIVTRWSGKSNITIEKFSDTEIQKLKDFIKKYDTLNSNTSDDIHELLEEYSDVIYTYNREHDRIVQGMGNPIFDIRTKFNLKMDDYGHAKLMENLENASPENVLFAAQVLRNTHLNTKEEALKRLNFDYSKLDLSPYKEFLESNGFKTDEHIAELVFSTPEELEIKKQRIIDRKSELPTEDYDGSIKKWKVIVNMTEEDYRAYLDNKNNLPANFEISDFSKLRQLQTSSDKEIVQELMNCKITKNNWRTMQDEEVNRFNVEQIGQLKEYAKQDKDFLFELINAKNPTDAKGTEPSFTYNEIVKLMEISDAHKTDIKEILELKHYFSAKDIKGLIRLKTVDETLYKKVISEPLIFNMQSGDAEYLADAAEVNLALTAILFEQSSCSKWEIAKIIDFCEKHPEAGEAIEKREKEGSLWAYETAALVDRAKNMSGDAVEFIKDVLEMKKEDGNYRFLSDFGTLLDCYGTNSEITKELINWKSKQKGLYVKAFNQHVPIDKPIEFNPHEIKQLIPLFQKDRATITEIIDTYVEARGKDQLAQIYELYKSEDRDLAIRLLDEKAINGKTPRFVPYQVKNIIPAMKDKPEQVEEMLLAKAINYGALVHAYSPEFIADYYDYPLSHVKDLMKLTTTDKDGNEVKLLNGWEIQRLQKFWLQTPEITAFLDEIKNNPKYHALFTVLSENNVEAFASNKKEILGILGKNGIEKANHIELIQKDKLGNSGIRLEGANDSKIITYHTDDKGHIEITGIETSREKYGKPDVNHIRHDYPDGRYLVEEIDNIRNYTKNTDSSARPLAISMKKTWYDSDGVQTRSEVLTPVEGKNGEYTINVYERGLNKAMKKSTAGTIKFYGSDNQGVRIEKTLVSPDKTTTKQTRIEGPKGQASTYEITKADGTVLYNQTRQHYQVNKNMYRTHIGEKGADGKTVITDTFEVLFEENDVIRVVHTAADGKMDFITFDSTVLDPNLKELFKQIPGDYFFRMKQAGLTRFELAEQGIEDNACFDDTNRKIQMSKETMNDPFVAIHELSHMIDIAILDEYHNSDEYQKVYHKELEAYKKVSGNHEEEKIIGYFSSTYHDYGRGEGESVAEIAANESGASHSEDFKLLGMRSVVLEQNMPEATALYLNKIKSIGYDPKPINPPEPPKDDKPYEIHSVISTAKPEMEREMPIEDPLNQNTDEAHELISNFITRLRQTSSGEDVTFKINGEERVFQAYKGNVASNGSYSVTDGENVYSLMPKASKELCQEVLLADELYCEVMGCLPREKVIVETDNGFAILAKSVFNKAGFTKPHANKDAIIQTYGMDVLLGNVDNVASLSIGENPVLISNNASINLRRTRNGFIEGQNAVYQLVSIFEEAHGLNPGSKNATEMRKASKEELIASLQKVADISDEQLLEIVNRSEVENKEQLGKILVGRKHFIARFLENLKATEQEGLPIEDYVRKVYQKTYGENTYEKLKEKTNTELTDIISEKFNFTELELLDYQKILQHPEFATHLKEKIEDGTVSKEDLIEFNKSIIFSDLSFIRENPNNKNLIFDTVLDLKKNNNMSIQGAYSLIRRFAQHKDGEVVSQRILSNIKEINQELNGNTNDALYLKLFKDIQTCEIDRTKLDIVKDLKNRGIDDKYLAVLLDNISNPDGTINVEKQNALNGLFEHNTPIEDIPMYFSAVNTPYGFDANMILLVDKYKELGLDNDLITNMVLSSRVTVEGGKRQQRTHALEILLLFPEEISNRKLLNEAFAELRSYWGAAIKIYIQKALEKNPNIKLADLIPMLRSFHKDRTFDRQSLNMAFRLLEDGVSPKGMGSFIAATKVTPRPVNGLTPEEAATQTTKLRDVGEYLLDSGYTTEQVYKLIEVAKTNGKIDDFVLEFIQNNCSNYNAKDLLEIVQYSKIIPKDNIPSETVNIQRQKIIDTITDLMKNKNYSGYDAVECIFQALSGQKNMMNLQITGLNTNTLEFCKKCADNDMSINDIKLLAYNSKIIDNVSGFTPEEINAKQKTMLDWADKLLFEDKLPPKTVAKFMEIAAFKTNRGKAGVRPITYNFDENVINVINRMIEEKAITPESDANIAQVIMAFKLLDYDENAITKAVELLKNPITLKNGKQYEMDSESIGFFIAGSKDKDSGKFDIDKFNRNADIYILKADHGFTIKELAILSKLYKGDITVDRLSTGQKVNLLNKLSYASKDAIELIQDKVIDTKDANDNIISGDIELLMKKLLTDINLASKNIRTNQAQRQEFLQNFISNKGRNPETSLNDIETKISQFDFTQYGKDGLPLKYSRNEFTANIREILADLTPEEQASILRYHNIDLGENGFNSNPRVRRINQSVETLTNEGYKNVITELSTLLKGINEDNLQLYKENNIDNIIKKCIQLSQLSESQIAELVRDYPELNLEDIKTLQTQAREFAELVENNDVGNLPTPLAVKTANEEIEGFNQFSDKMKSASARIEQEYNKFIYENEFKTGDAELDNILNGIMRGLPDVMLTVGKQQHKTHAYSVDVHTMEVLKKAMNDPEYKTLSDKDRTILKFSILLHDFGKKFINPETPDTGHEVDSAEIASGIMAQFKLPATVKERILNIIKNHDWFARYNKSDWNANKVAALFRSPDDYKIAKIMSKADLFSINPDFQYDPKVLNIKEDRTIEHASRVFDEKLKNLDAAYQKMYAKTNIVMNSKILNPSKIPMDEQYGVRVLNLTDENIPSDMDLGQYGMNGTTKDNLRLTVHMVAEDNLLGNLESAKLGMESTTNDNNVWSISMIKMDRTRTYMYREYGFATDTPISSIAIASPNNLSSGYEKGVDKFVELLFTNNPQRNFLKQRFMMSAQAQGRRMSEADYQELSRMVYNKSFLSQLETQSEIEVNGNTYPTSVIVKAIQESTDALFTGQTHTEFVASNPKIQGLVVRKNSMAEVAPDFIAFAKKYDLPILLVGNK